MFERRDTTIVLELDEHEAELLRRILGEYRSVLDTADKNDPVMKRLYPSASLDDPQVSADFDSLTKDSLEEHKRQTLEVADATLGGSGACRTDLSQEQAESWVTLLTDVRLALGVSIGVTEDLMDEELDPNDPDSFPLALLHYLGVMQESLVEALSYRSSDQAT